ncbi:acetylcholine receptor subunit alpha-like isoform X1 [Arapaima gigas]
MLHLPLYFIVNFTIPCLLFCFLPGVVFYLPGEKMTPGISVLFSLPAFLLVIVQLFPTPFVIAYIVLTVVVFNIRHPAPTLCPRLRLIGTTKRARQRKRFSPTSRSSTVNRPSRGKQEKHLLDISDMRESSPATKSSMLVARQTEEEAKNAAAEWRSVAMVPDRILLCVFVTVYIVGI